MVLALAANVFAAQKCVTKEANLFFLAEKDIEEAIDYFVLEDNGAIHEMDRQKRILVLKPGTLVYLRGEYNGYKINVRLKGHTHWGWTMACFWIARKRNEIGRDRFF